MIAQVCDVWESVSRTELVHQPVACRSAISLAGATNHPRFAYVSVGSPIEQLIGGSSAIADRSGTTLSVGQLTDRLLDGEVAGVLAPPTPTTPTTNLAALPAPFIERRQQLRQENVLARFLLRQIGLEEVSTHVGAPAALYDQIAELWSLDLALCTDPAMLLTLGADRQRYVDADYKKRAKSRLPRAMGRLVDMGVSPYPRLVII